MKARSSEFTAYLAYLHRIPAPLSSEESSVDDKGFDICSSVACTFSSRPRAAFILDKPPPPLLHFSYTVAPLAVEIRGRRPRQPGRAALFPPRAAVPAK